MTRALAMISGGLDSTLAAKNNKRTRNRCNRNMF